MKDAVIKKFVLELGGKEISLTPEQAKKLYEGLSELFEKKVIVEERHHYHPSYPWIYTVPSTGITVAPTYPFTTNPIWYTSSGGVDFSMSDGTMTCSMPN